jgi:glucose-6-phosphate 1-dehydrogenase
MDNKQKSPVALVIFGVTGDLASRKLIPAVYELIKADRLNSPIHIIGFARRDWTDETLTGVMVDSIREFGGEEAKPDDRNIRRMVEYARYIQSDFNDELGYQKLGEYLKQIQCGNTIFYLATPPESYLAIIEKIGETHLADETDGWRRIIVEKPYGRDLQTAEELEQKIHLSFKESQIYRIDHYLGKETVQNILVFRFANGIFEPLWNRNYIDHIQITVAETVGVETRAGFYESAGVIRDVFQNHLLQLLTLTAMEAPVAFKPNAVRDEKVKVLQALCSMDEKDVQANTFRGQYVSGLVDGKRVPSYRDEKGVSPISTTETYMAARVFVDNWRWSGVPFYLRSGKRLPQRRTEIAIQFKQVPLALFNAVHLAYNVPNVLVLNIQPEEGITLTFGAKIPGLLNQVEQVNMEFNYVKTFGMEPPEAYQRLLLDCLSGDATLFTRSDEVKAAWTFTNDIISGWDHQNLKNLPIYEAGTWGPSKADDFIQQDSRKWRNDSKG